MNRLQQLWFTATDTGQKCIPLVRETPRSAHRDHSNEAQAESFMQLMVLKGIPSFTVKPSWTTRLPLLLQW